VDRPAHDRIQAEVLTLTGFVLKEPVSFIIDSGAERSVINKRFVPDVLCLPTDIQLSGVDGKVLNIHGHFNSVIEVPTLRRDYKMNLIITDTASILGADFLVNYGLLLNMKDKRLIDPLANIAAKLENKRYESSTIRITDSCAELNFASKHFPALVEAPDYSLLPTNRGPCHEINTKGGPIYSKPRPLSPDKFKVAKSEFDKLLKLNIIRPSSSPWSSPLHMVRKADGSWRPCGDYRRLNSLTTPDRYPIPNINHIFDKVAGSKIFSKVDLVKAYHFIPMKEEDVCKTAIATPFGNFEFLRMPFGLRNAASSFQRYIDNIVRDLSFVTAYIDDILIFSTDEVEHEKHLKTLCNRLQSHGLKINDRKSIFFASSVDFLGYQVSANGFRPMADRVAALQNLPSPSDQKVLQRYLGMFGFYQKCIPNYSEVVKPLRHLMKAEKFVWDKIHENTFDKLKSAISDAANFL